MREAGYAARRALLGAAAVTIIAGRAGAQGTRVITLGTATPGGGFPAFGVAFAATIEEIDPELRIEQRNTRGSTENVTLLESRALDIALVQGEAAHEALSGIGRPRADLRIIAAMYSNPGFFAVRGDSTARTIADLRGQPVAFGARGSGLVILARYVLDGLGLDMERDFQAVFLERAGDGPAMVLDGRVAALWGGGVGWPGFVAIVRGPEGARFIAPDAEEIARIRARHSFLRALTLPPGSYPGQDAPIASVGSWSFVMTHPNFNDHIAWRLARALHRGEAAIARRLDQARETTAANTAAAADPALLHPGVRRYLREIGALR